MDHSRYPSTRRLIIVWLILMTAALATLLAGTITGDKAVGPVWMAVAMIAASIKMLLILEYFLDLRSAGAGWRRAFNTLAVIFPATVFVIYLI